MPRKHIDDTPTSNEYMFEDSIYTFTMEDRDDALELEDSSGYLMFESWRGTLGGGLVPGTFEDYLSRDIIRVKSRIRRM